MYTRVRYLKLLDIFPYKTGLMQSSKCSHTLPELLPPNRWIKAAISPSQDKSVIIPKKQNMDCSTNHTVKATFFASFF